MQELIPSTQDAWDIDEQPQVVPQKVQKRRMAAVRTTTTQVAFGWSSKKLRIGPTAMQHSKHAGLVSGTGAQPSKASQQLNALEQINLVGRKATGPKVSVAIACGSFY